MRYLIIITSLNSLVRNIVLYFTRLRYHYQEQIARDYYEVRNNYTWKEFTE